MSDDPQTVEQIRALARDDRPLLVLDVDEVVLEFVRPFMRFLEGQQLRLRTDSFNIHGNVVDHATGVALERERVSLLIDGFFDAQADWQQPVEGVVDVLHALRPEAEIVMLTAMPHRHRTRRRALLDRLGLDFPLVTTEAAKGPAILMLRGDKPRPVAFVDDIPHNLASVRASIADASLFHLMAYAELASLLPELPADVFVTTGWPDAHPKIGTALGLS